jgi:hypothetical protein
MNEVGEIVDAWVVGGHVLPESVGDLATGEELGEFIAGCAPGDVLVAHEDGTVELLAGDEFALTYDWIAE